MSRLSRTNTPRATDSSGLGLGDRLRQLRVAAGITQGELAGDRFSKEYVSQIERGKTRPTAETVEWLAARLGAHRDILARGVSSGQEARLEALLARAEALSEAHEHDEAIAAYADLQTCVAAVSAPEYAVRALKGEARTRARRGDVREALALAQRARELVEAPAFCDLERAEVLFLLGVFRYMLSSITTALGLLNEALALAQRSPLPSDHLRSEILHWRSRCYRRHRDYAAAKEDVELALELAEAGDDRHTAAQLYYQASLLADREGHWVLARSYAERAKSIYEEMNDRTNLGRLQNSLGALSFLLGDPAAAVQHLKESFATALDVGNQAEAAQAVSSLAQVHLRTGNVELAEEQARHALRLLGDREDFLDEIGGSQLVLGRALLEQGRLDEADAAFLAAEGSFDQLSSGSHRASAWVARGDVAARRGDDRAAAALYRRAAEALQDVRF